MGLLSFLTGDGAYQKAITDLNANKAMETSYWQKKAHEDYLNNSENQAVLRQARQLFIDGNRRAANRGVVSGATDESVAQQKAANNASMENIIAGIASESSNKKEQAMQNYLEANRQYTQAINNMNIQKDQNESAALGGLLKAGIGVAGSIMGGPVGGALAGQFIKKWG